MSSKFPKYLPVPLILPGEKTSAQELLFHFTVCLHLIAVREWTQVKQAKGQGRKLWLSRFYNQFLCERKTIFHNHFMPLNLNKRNELNEALQNTAVINRKSFSLPSLVHGQKYYSQIKIYNNKKNLANLLKHADRWMELHEVNGASITCVLSINSSRSGNINQWPLSR